MLIGEYCCPRWTPGGGFRWALRTQAAPLPVIIWHQVADRRSLLTFFFVDTSGEKEKAAAESYTDVFPPPLSAPVAGLKSISVAGWMSRVALTCCGKDPHHAAAALFSSSVIAAARSGLARGTAETSQMQNVKKPLLQSNMSERQRV